MYIPVWSALLQFVQLPLPLLDADQPILNPVVPDTRFEPQYAREAIYNLGNLSPYHDAPTVTGVFPDLPVDCTVDQVVLLHRHGSRGPGGEQKFIQGLANTLDKAWHILQTTPLPSNLEFLREPGYKDELVAEQLTAVGRKELLDHGSEFALRYPKLSTDLVVSSASQRVIDSAHFFGKGFFGPGISHVTFVTTNKSDDSLWLAASDLCPKMSQVVSNAHKTANEWATKFITPIVERLNKVIPGMNFSFEDIQGALYACPYDLASREISPWCSVFTADELAGLEYEQDVFMDSMTGHDASKDPGPLVGAFYIKELIKRLKNDGGNAKPLYLEFAHDANILYVLSTMKLNKDALPLDPRVAKPPPDRKFRTSYQAPFAASMTWEKFTCKTSFTGPQVRLVLNEATFPLTICAKSADDKKYGTCSLNEFEQANKYSLGVEYQSAAWDNVCGKSN